MDCHISYLPLHLWIAETGYIRVEPVSVTDLPRVCPFVARGRGYTCQITGRGAAENREPMYPALARRQTQSRSFYLYNNPWELRARGHLCTNTKVVRPCLVHKCVFGKVHWQASNNPHQCSRDHRGDASGLTRQLHRAGESYLSLLKSSYFYRYTCDPDSDPSISVLWPTHHPRLHSITSSSFHLLEP